ncbi:hypothetical protein JQ91_003564 [Salmonella enterica subsp. enterica]|nr:hypothetical protein [Salmonella enterica subsp. enterica]EDR2558777.1 hypothetical protein [Salmonella enterica subsp. enterica]EDR2618623.1 hypothetical protein [Salmonella enterica subsp. enterica]EGI5589687.1 hypothetical protein [Salmonella enterica subsp. enterica serovar Butantan]
MAAFAHASHVFIYAPGGSFSCRLDATRMILCILFSAIITVKNISSSFPNIPIAVYFKLDFSFIY